jgi:hypothetical protein
MNRKIYAPNIHLFRYYLCNKSEDHVVDLTKEYQFLFKAFNLKENDFYLKEFQDDHDDRLPLYYDNSTKSSFLYLEQQLERQDEIKITGQAFPVQLYDSCGLIFNIRVDEKDKNGLSSPGVDLGILKDTLNPDKCLLRLKDSSILGQTIILTVWLDSKMGNYQAIADQCIKNFFNAEENVPRLYQENELFGQPIFEYGNPRELDKDYHVLVWIFFKEANSFDNLAEKIFCACYHEFIDLFFYFHKATKAFTDSRSIYKEIREKYKEIDAEIDQIGIDSNLDKEEMLKKLQNILKKLPSNVLEYERLLRKLSERSLFFELAARNYETRSKGIQNKLAEDIEFPVRNLTFLSDFSKRTFRSLRDQIAADLAYSQNYSGVSAQAIAAIRGIVEIEQTRLDRENQEAEKEREKAEKERERELQLTILAVGAGVSAGGILASSSGHLDAESLSLASVKNPQLYLFFGSLIWSLIFGVAIGFLVYGVMKAIDRILKGR